MRSTPLSSLSTRTTKEREERERTGGREKEEKRLLSSPFSSPGSGGGRVGVTREELGAKQASFVFSLASSFILIVTLNSFLTKVESFLQIVFSLPPRPSLCFQLCLWPRLIARAPAAECGLQPIPCRNHRVLGHKAGDCRARQSACCGCC